MNLNKSVRFADQSTMQNTQVRAQNFQTALRDLRNSFNSHVTKLSASKIQETQPIMAESIQTITTTPQRQGIQYCQPQQFMPLQPMCQNQCGPCQPIQQPYVVYQSQEKQQKKKKKKQQEESEIITVTPKRQHEPVKLHDPSIDNLRSDIRNLEQTILSIQKPAPQSEQREIQIQMNENSGNDKDCVKKLCKKIKKLEKDLYEVSRQRDEALIIRTTLERENQEMFDRVNELEALLKAADKKIFDLSIMNERFQSYQKQLEDEVTRLQRKKKKRLPAEIREVVIEKIVEKPIEIIQHIPVDRVVEKPIEIIREVPVERFVDRIVEVPRTEYVDRPVPQIIEKIIEVPIDRIKEVPVLQDKIVEVPVDRPVFVDRIVEVPVEKIVEVEKIVKIPVEKIIEVPVERIVEVIKEVPRIEYIDRPFDRPVDRPIYVDRPIELIDDREIRKLQGENEEIMRHFRELRGRYESCLNELDIQRKTGLDGQNLLDQLSVRNIKLEDQVTREREIVSDLQHRLDLMYLEVEKLTSENNRKNEEYQRHLMRIQDEFKKRLEAQGQIIQMIQQGQQTQIQHVNSPVRQVLPQVNFIQQPVIPQPQVSFVSPIQPQPQVNTHSPVRQVLPQVGFVQQSILSQPQQVNYVHQGRNFSPVLGNQVYTAGPAFAQSSIRNISPQVIQQNPQSVRNISPSLHTIQSLPVTQLQQ